MSPVRTTRDYRCGECGAKPGEPCIRAVTDHRPLYHRDRELRFIRSVNRQIARGVERDRVQ